MGVSAGSGFCVRGSAVHGTRFAAGVSAGSGFAGAEMKEKREASEGVSLAHLCVKVLAVVVGEQFFVIAEQDEFRDGNGGAGTGFGLGGVEEFEPAAGLKRGGMPGHGLCEKSVERARANAHLGFAMDALDGFENPGHFCSGFSRGEEYRGVIEEEQLGAHFLKKRVECFFVRGLFAD